MVSVSQNRLHRLAAGLYARGLVDSAFVGRMKACEPSRDDLAAIRGLERSLSSMTDSFIGESFARLCGWRPNANDQLRVGQRQDVLAMRMALQNHFADRNFVVAALEGLKNAFT